MVNIPARNRAVQRVSRPRVGHGIPKPLSVEKAAAVVEGGMAAHVDWIAARNAAVLLLLYGSGLRISEALGIVRRDAPTEGREMLRVVGKGGKQRPVPVLPVTQAAVSRYVALCPYRLAPDGPLFLGAKADLIPSFNSNYWSADLTALINPSETRRKFSLATCDGCHDRETDTKFSHLGQLGHRWMGHKSEQSYFLDGGNPFLIVPVTGETHLYDDLLEREKKMSDILNASCTRLMATSKSAFAH